MVMNKVAFSLIGNKLHILLIYSLLFLVSACSDSHANKQEEKQYFHAANIATAALSSSYEVPRKYIGKITSKQQTNLTFEFSGRVTNVFADSGEKVSKGQLLAQLDTQLLEIKRRETIAQINQLNAQQVLNQKKLTRINSLEKNGFSSVQQQDELNSEASILSASIEQLTAVKETIIYQINNSKLYAPYHGVITKRTINQGEFINSNHLAFNMIKDQDVEFIVGIPVKDIKTLSLNSGVTITLNDTLHSTKVIAIGKQINSVNRTVELRLRAPKNIELLNGQFGYLHINQLINKPGFWLPLSALTDGVRGQWNIYQTYQVNDNVFQINTQTVTVEYSNNTHAYISGLTGKEFHYIKDGLHRLVPKQKVIAAKQDLVAITDKGEL